MITHLMQPTNNSCVVTCIAMLAGLTQEELNEDFKTDGELSQLHSAFEKNPSVETLLPYFRSKRLGFALPTSDVFVTDSFYFGCNYLLIVPSLGVLPGKLHCVLLECPDKEYPKLHDPAMGVSGARYYVNKTESIINGLQVHLDSWVIALEVFAK